MKKPLPHKINISGTFKRKLGKINIDHKDTVIATTKDILKNPSIGDTMKGTFQKLGFKYFKIKDTNPEYRIIYKDYSCNTGEACSLGIIHDNNAPLKDCLGVVDFVIVGSREDFNNYYGMSKKEIKGWILS